jgi:pimeloyl-ACP methyl ester carboxylesterase
VPSLTTKDGVNLHYEVEGEGPPLVLHLGAGGDSSVWRTAGHVAALSPSNRCILFDHRGHGESDHPSGPEANHIDRYVDDIVALLDHLELESASFWGYSTAVPVGMKAAQEHGSRFEKLVFSGAVSGATPTADQLSSQSATRVTELSEHAWEQMIASYDQHEPQPVPRWFKEAIRATDIDPYIDWFLARPSWGWNPVEAFGVITQPVLFLVGEAEDPKNLMAAVAGAMRNATLLRIPGQGAANSFIKSELTMPLVLSFLAGD